MAAAPISPAGAQATEIAGFLKNVTDIGIFGGFGTFLPKTTEIDGRNGKKYSTLGFELSFAVGAISCEAEMVARSNEPPETRHRYLFRGDSVRRCIQRTSAPSAENSGARIRGAVGADTVARAPTPGRKAALRDTSWLFEFALGYGQVSGFRSTDPKLELHGAVREAPVISVYATNEHPIAWTPFSVYFGLRSGLLQLQNVRIYMDTSVASGGSSTSSVVYTGTASTFLGGLALGLVTDVGPTSWFVEGAYAWRSLPSVEWTGPGKLLPKNLPRQMNLSGANFTIGIQIPISAGKGGGGAADDAAGGTSSNKKGGG